MKKRLVAILVLIAMCTLCACSGGGDYELRRVDGKYYCDGFKNQSDIPDELYLPAVIEGRPIYEIGGNAFEDSELIALEIGEGIPRLGDHIFSGSRDLETVKLPSSLEYIGMSTFMGCISLTEIHIPENVTNLDIWAFSECRGLETVVIEGKLDTLDREVFKDCAGLKVVYLPQTIANIYQGAFSGCNALEEIHFAGTIEAFLDIDFSMDWLSAESVLVCCADGNIILENSNSWYRTEQEAAYPADPLAALTK